MKNKDYIDFLPGMGKSIVIIGSKVIETRSHCEHFTV